MVTVHVCRGRSARAGRALAVAPGRDPSRSRRPGRRDRRAGHRPQTFAQMHAPILVERARRLAYDLGLTLES